jgi:hypothetical protein
MAEHDYVIDNQSAPAFRADLNNALQAIVSNNSKGTAPTVTYANMTWYDTATNWIFVRNETNSAWIRFAYLDQATNKISLVDDTKVVNTSGTQTGLLGDQTTAAWQAGTGTTQSLVSPANVKSAIDALASSSTTFGSVGTYVWAATYDYTSTEYLPNATIAGSLLYVAGVAIASFSTSDLPSGTNVGESAKPAWTSTTALSGTWRAMGYNPSSASGSSSLRWKGMTLWLRIS